MLNSLRSSYCLCHLLLFCSHLPVVFALPFSSWPSTYPPGSETYQIFSRTNGVTPLDDGWSMHVNNIGCFLPFQVAAADLMHFYAGILGNAHRMLARNEPRRPRLNYSLGTISLLLMSTELLEWDWVISFAEQMVGLVLPSVNSPCNHEIMLMSPAGY